VAPRSSGGEIGQCTRRTESVQNPGPVEGLVGRDLFQAANQSRSGCREKSWDGHHDGAAPWDIAGLSRSPHGFDVGRGTGEND